ncbi:MAG: hypothetical protein DCF22_15720 [Leptolyngbya sp.]|nr:MAG: hypothetical protein DCF22_15720 [Leptolyngbya sp.]
MAIFRQYVAPLLIVFVFLFALVAVSSRIFMPMDMAAPAPIESIPPQIQNSGLYKPTNSHKATNLPPSLSALITGLNDEST